MQTNLLYQPLVCGMRLAGDYITSYQSRLRLLVLGTSGKHREATYLLADKRQLEPNDLLHLLLNLLEVTVCDWIWHVKVVKKSMLDPGPNCDLGPGEQPLHAHCHDMGTLPTKTSSGLDVSVSKG